MTWRPLQIYLLKIGKVRNRKLKNITIKESDNIGIENLGIGN